VADLLAALMMVPKAWREPHSETLSTFVLASASGALTALAVGTLSVPLLAYPVYFVAVNAGLAAVILGGRRVHDRRAPWRLRRRRSDLRCFPDSPGLRRAETRSTGSRCRDDERERGNDMTSIDEDYLLGHEDAELARLEHQAGILAPATEAILRMAGLAPGMRVLDLGTGLGDVAFAAAGIVGPTGEVVGIDQNRSVVARATSRAAERGARQRRFEVGDVGTWHDGSRFDAVVGG
jgi:hypothetical protein